MPTFEPDSRDEGLFADPIQPRDRRAPLAPAVGGQRAAGASNRPILVEPTADNPLPDAVYDEEDEVDDLQEILRNAPAWLVSTVFHTTLLIVLALVAAVSSGLQIASSNVEVTSIADQMAGTQLEDPNVLEGDSPHVENPTEKEQMITPRDLAPVDDPIAAPPTLGDIKFDIGSTGESVLAGPKMIEGAPIGLALSGRRPGSKNVLLGRYGGTAVTERAVELGLQWLAKQQKSDGSWSLAGPFSSGSLGENSAAATAMALLAFQGHGDTTRDGPYSKVVAKGWNWLLKVQRKDGSFGGAAMSESNQLLYTHAQCTIALCELLGMTKDSQYRGPAERAIAFCVSAQDKSRGGWRYIPGQDSDTSVTGWFVMALQSARMAGMAVPADTLKGASDYLDKAALMDGRRYGYWQIANPSWAMAAEGLLCREYLGWKQNDPRLVDGVSELLKTPVSYEQFAEQDVYYWYYATQATHHLGGKVWDEWNRVMREQIPAHQVKAGAEAGSWNPQGDKWGSFGGRLYVTCLSIFNLEVYYRHLPIYSSQVWNETHPESALDAEGKSKPTEGNDATPPADSKPAGPPPDAVEKPAP
jgi:hypothetical protein